MIPIANPCEAPDLVLRPSGLERPYGSYAHDLYRMWVGASTGAGTEAYVWARSFEAALEAFVNWLDDENLCGDFVTIGIAELEDAALQLGFPTSVAHDPQHPDFQQVLEKAEEDLTLVTGHTTMQNCPNPGYFVSHDWGGDELDWKQHLDVVRGSYGLCSNHNFIPGDIVYALKDDIYDPVPSWEAGHAFRVTRTGSRELVIESLTTGEEYDLDEDYFGGFSLKRPTPAPASRRTGYSVPDDEEKKRMMDFFFPKSTLPKSRPGGGGFLGLPRRGPFRIKSFFRR